MEAIDELHISDYFFIQIFLNFIIENFFYPVGLEDFIFIFGNFLVKKVVKEDKKNEEVILVPDCFLFTGKDNTKTIRILSLNIININSNGLST